MTERIIGAVLLMTAGVCVTIGMVGAKLAFALQAGMFSMGKGGISPQRPELGWETGIAVIVLAVAGFRLLVRGGRGQVEEDGSN